MPKGRRPTASSKKRSQRKRHPKPPNHEGTKDDHITPPNAFPFLRLRPELRNKIYRLCVLSVNPFDRPEDYDGESCSDKEWDIPVFLCPVPSILHVSHQIRHEAAEIYWRENCFMMLGLYKWGGIKDAAGATAVMRPHVEACVPGLRDFKVWSMEERDEHLKGVGQLVDGMAPAP